MKTETKPTHTPGPWNQNVWHSVKSSDDLRTIAITHDLRRGTSPSLDECAANARLIAAAPELLEALKTGRNCLFAMFKKQQGEAFVKGQAMDLWDEIKEMNDAISKAEGR